MDRDLPQPSEQILVRFSLPDGRRVQWPTTVEEVQPVSAAGNVLATATLVYAAAHGYLQERCRVQFLEGYLLRPEPSCGTDRDVTSWLFEEEEAGADEDCEAEEMSRSGAPSGGRKKRHEAEQ